MKSLRRAAITVAGASTLALGLLHVGAAPVRTVVDLELALAIDTSASVNISEYRLQMDSLIRAFQDKAVIAAIRGTGAAGIAVTVFHWNSTGRQKQIVPWTQLTDAATSIAFARAIASNLVRRYRYNHSTGIGDALHFGSSLIRNNRFEGRRKSIDISGDGRNNSGIAPHIARKEVLGLGITINGLAILNDDPQLHHYFRRHVIGGPGAFVITVADYKDIISGMRKKLLREISATVSSRGKPRTYSILSGPRN